MKVIAVSGSPRKNWNTDTMLQKAIEGAASTGAETQIFYLRDLKYRGCIDCKSCKLKGGKSVGRCVLKDDLTDVLQAAHEADVIIMGSPIYWFDVTGMMRSFMERLLYQYLSYDHPYEPLCEPKKTAFIYTMNTPENSVESSYRDFFNKNESTMKFIFRHCETLYATETLQVKDYSRFHLGCIDGNARLERHATVFPQDCQRAFEFGVHLCTEQSD